MNYFIDCGAWTGCSVEYFRKHYPGAEKFNIICFEPYEPNIKKLRTQKGIEIYTVAVWDLDGYERFYFGNDDGGSMCSNKSTGGIRQDQFVTVRTIDFAAFIRQRFDQDDFIICKLNIEGAEYRVLQHLERNQLLSWIDRWYIEWHHEKLQGFDPAEHNRISNLVSWSPWMAQAGGRLIP